MQMTKSEIQITNKSEFHFPIVKTSAARDTQIPMTTSVTAGVNWKTIGRGNYGDHPLL
jgi:hypothetical protein